MRLAARITGVVNLTWRDLIVISRLARQTGYSGPVISDRQLSRSLVSALEQFEEHHCCAGC